jgi:hypothetical protein
MTTKAATTRDRDDDQPGDAHPPGAGNPPCALMSVSRSDGRTYAAFWISI